MATINAISVALFNAAAGGYSAEMEKNGAAFANAVGPVLEKDISTDALFVEHLLGNLGVTSTSAVYAQAKAAVAGLVTTKGRLGATVDAVDFLKAQEGSTSAYATIAADFAAKVNKAALFTAANPTERDVTKLISGVTGVDTDAAAISAAAAAATAAAEAKAAAAATAAATAAAAAAATAAAEAKAAAEKVAADAAAAAKTAADAAAAKAAADAKAAAEKVAADAAAAAKTAADAAAATAAAEAKAAAEKVAADAAAAAKAAADAALAAVDNTTYASEQAALDAANAAAATAAAAAKAEADAAAAKAAADLAAANATITSLQNPAGGSFALTTSTSDVLIGVGIRDAFTGATSTDDATDIIVDAAQGDNDTLTMTLTADLPAITTINVENVILNSSALIGVDVNLANIANATTTVNLTGVGSNGIVTADNLKGSSQLVAGTGVTRLTVTDAADGATVTAGAATTRVDIESSAASQAMTVNVSAVTVDVNNAVIGTGAVVADLTINFAADTDVVLDAIGDELIVTGATGAISAVSSVLNAETVTNNMTGTFSIDVDIDGAHDLSDVAASRLDLTYNANGGVVNFADTGANLRIDETFGAATTATGTSSTESTNSITAIVSTSALTNFNFANYRTVNLSADEDTTITSLSIEATNNLVLSGSSDITLATDVTALSVNGSAMTGDLSATFNNAMATAVGGAGDDSFDFTSGTTTTVTVTGNAGDDTITFAGGAATRVTVNGGEGNDNLSVNTTQATISYTAGDGNDTLTLANGNYSAGSLTLTSVEILAVTTGGATTLDSSTVSGKTYVLSGNAAAGDVVLAVDGSTIDASGLVSDSAIGITNTVAAIAGVSLTITGTAYADVLAGDDVADYIDGGSGDDKITAGTGADTILGGAGADDIDGQGGADTITAGTGADEVIAEGGDTISLTETTSAADNIIVQSVTAGSAVGAAGGTFSSYNVITGFTSTVDDFVFDDGTTADFVGDTVAAGDEIIDTVDIYAATLATGTDNDLAVADIADVDAVLQFLNAAGVAHVGGTNGDVDLVVITFTDFSAIYTVTDADVTDGAILAAELTLIGTVDEKLVAGDLIIT
jgi:hypothetical protein